MKAEEFVAGLRALADWYEAHPDMPVPYDPSIHVGAEDTKEEALRIAAALRPCDKVWSDSYLTLARNFHGGIEIRFIFQRQAVCEKRVIGVREIPEQVIPARTEEIVKWDCHPLLAAE